MAFSWHGGLPSSFLLVRFAAGSALAAAVVLLTAGRSRASGRILPATSGPQPPPAPEVQRLSAGRAGVSGRVACGLAAVSGALAVVLAVLSAEHVSAAAVTAGGLALPVMLLAGSALAGLRRPSLFQMVSGGMVLLAAAVLSFAMPSPDAAQSGQAAGAALLAGSVVSGAVSSILWARFGSSEGVASHVLKVSLWGVVLSAVMFAVSPGLTAGQAAFGARTVLSALFVAVLPGTAGMLVVSWALLRVPPFAVAALAPAALLPAVAGDVLLSGADLTPVSVVAVATAASGSVLLAFSQRSGHRPG